MLTEQTTETPLEALTPVASAQDVLGGDRGRASASSSRRAIQRYVVALLRQTRGDSRLYLGASPRAGINLLRVAKARALVAGRDYVVPDDVKSIAPVRARASPDPRAGGPLGRPLGRGHRARRRRAHAGPGLGARDADRPRPVAARARRPDLPRRLGVRRARRSTRSRSGSCSPSRAPRSGCASSAGRCASAARSGAGSTSRATTCPSARARRATGGCRRSTLVVARADRAPRRVGGAAPTARPACSAGDYVLVGVPRGRYPSSRLAVVIEDPFGLERAEVDLSRPESLLVYPRLVELERALLGRGRRRRPAGGGCSCAGRPASSSTRCASTSRASRCAASTGPRPRGAAS